MDRATKAACRDELRRAGVPGDDTLARLLALLRAAPEPHLSLGQVLRIVHENKLGLSAADVAGQLQMLADRGLLGRLPVGAAEPVFDTVAEPHAHVIYEYEEDRQTVDLHVSPETLVALVRQLLAEQPGRVDIMIRVRGWQGDQRKAFPLVSGRNAVSRPINGRNEQTR